MKKKFVIVTTIPATLGFFRGNLKFLSDTYDICAVSSDKEKLETFAGSEGVASHYIPMKRQISLVSDFVSLFRFILFFLKQRPDIVHGNTPKGAMLSMLAAWLTRVPVRIYMCHGLRYQGTQGKMRKLLMWMERLTCSCATQVISVSKGVRSTLISDDVCKEKKIMVVGDGSAAGIDLARFDISKVDSTIVREQLGIPPSDFVFIFVGRIVKDKGINELVSAFTRLSEENNLHLILVGAEERELNPISNDTRKQIEANAQIHAVGRQADVRPYLNCADAFVFPSYREGFGMVLIEAQAMGVPCISSDIIGCNEIIIPGENGELIPAKDADVLYERMKDWVEHPDKVAYMARNARRLVAERYEQKMVWNALLETYRKLSEN